MPFRINLHKLSVAVLICLATVCVLHARNIDATDAHDEAMLIMKASDAVSSLDRSQASTERIRAAARLVPVLNDYADMLASNRLDPKGSMKMAALKACADAAERYSEECPEALARTADFAKRLGRGTLLSAAGGVNAENAAAYAAAGAVILVTSWPYWGRPRDVKMTFAREA